MQKIEKSVLERALKKSGFKYEKFSEKYIKKLDADMFCYICYFNTADNYLDIVCGVTSSIVSNLVIECFKYRYPEFIPFQSMEKTFPIIYAEIDRYLPNLSPFMDKKRNEKISDAEQKHIAKSIAEQLPPILQKYTDLGMAAREGEAALTTIEVQAFGIFFSYIASGDKDEALSFINRIKPLPSRWSEYLVAYVTGQDFHNDVEKDNSIVGGEHLFDLEEAIIKHIDDKQLRDIVKNTGFIVEPKSKVLDYTKITLNKSISEKQKSFIYKCNFKKITIGHMAIIMLRWFGDSSYVILNYEINSAATTSNSWTINLLGEIEDIKGDCIDNSLILITSYKNWLFDDYNDLSQHERKFVKAAVSVVTKALSSLNSFRMISSELNDYIFVSGGMICFYSDDDEKLINIENLINSIDYQKRG